jgi:Putative auto-transporter adhesin, head GIN domain
MKRFAIIPVVLLLASCNFYSESGSGNIITQKRNLTAFTGIESSNSIEVDVRIGAPSVEVEADDNIIQLVETRVSGNTLHIGLEKGTSLYNTHIKVTVTAPEIKQIKAHSSSEVKVLDIIKTNDKLRFDASSSADIEAAVEAPEVDADASSSASIRLSGRTKNYRAEVSSSADIRSFDLLSENTTVSANSSGSADVHASVNLTANASSSGSIDYTGGATVKVNTSSSGTVHKKE